MSKNFGNKINLSAEVRFSSIRVFKPQTSICMFFVSFLGIQPMILVIQDAISCTKTITTVIMEVAV